MHVHALRRDPLPEDITASMRLPDGGEDELWVVARRIARRMKEVWRLVDNVVLIKEALSLRMPLKILSCFRRPINSMEMSGLGRIY